MERDELIAEIRKAYREDDTLRLTALCGQAAEEYPESAEALALCAVSLYWQDHKEEAIEAARRAIELRPDEAIVWAAQSTISTCEGDTDTSLLAAGKAVSLAPLDPLVVSFSTGAYSFNGDHGTGLAITERYLREYPDDIDMLHHQITQLRNAGRTQDAEVLLTDCERRLPRSYRWMHQRARVLMMSGRLAQAIELLQEAARQAPGSHQYSAELSMALSAAQRDEEAEESARRALEICPCSTVAMGTMAGICRRRDDNKQAEYWAKKAAEAIPALGLFGQIRKATLATRKGDWEAVIELTEPVLSTQSLTIRSNALGQRFRAFLALKRLDEAATTLSELESIDSTTREIYEHRAKLLEASGDVFEAVSVARSGVERYPADGILRSLLLKLLHSMNAGDEQDEIVRSLMENPPDLPAGVTTAYMALSDTKHDAEAMEFLSRARKQLPNSEELQLFEAVKKLEKGDYAGARAATKGMKGEAAKVAKKLRTAAWFMQIMDKLLFFLRKPKPGG